MARPCKSIETMSKHLTKEEIEKRKTNEEKLRGEADKIRPPSCLTKNQKNFFNYIVTELEASGILTNLDIFILEKCAICLDRIRKSEKLLNKDILDKDALRVKESYTKEFFRCCNELSLSPQSRAKLGNLNIQAQAENEDPLLLALKGNKD